MIPDHPVIQNMERTGYPDGIEPKGVYTCDYCGQDIYDGEDYYELFLGKKLGSQKWCETCVEKARETVETEEPDYYEY